MGVARLLFHERFSQKKRMKHNGEASSGLVGVQRSTSFLFSATFYSSVMSSSIEQHKHGLQSASVMENWGGGVAEITVSHSSLYSSNKPLTTITKSAMMIKKKQWQNIKMGKGDQDISEEVICKKPNQTYFNQAERFQSKACLKHQP